MLFVFRELSNNVDMLFRFDISQVSRVIDYILTHSNVSMSMPPYTCHIVYNHVIHVRP